MELRHALRLGLHRALLLDGLQWALGEVREQGARALDLGCGSGPYHGLLRQKAEMVVGCDWHPAAPAFLVRGTADALPFSGDAFDLVLSTQVFEHVPDPLAVAREAYRALRPGGTMVLSVPQMVALHEAPYDFFRYTEYGVRHVLAEAGFRGVEIRPLGGFWAMLAQQLEFRLLWDRGALAMAPSY